VLQNHLPLQKEELILSFSPSFSLLVLILIHYSFSSPQNLTVFTFLRGLLNLEVLRVSVLQVAEQVTKEHFQ